MNKLSGRTKFLKQVVARDKKVALEKEIIAKFSKETMAEGFGIPLKNMDGFLTYCLFQSDFSELAKANNTLETWEYLKRKSIEFKKTE